MIKKDPIHVRFDPGRRMLDSRTGGSRVRIENTVDPVDGEMIVHVEIRLSDLHGEAPFLVNGDGDVSVTLLEQKQTVVAGERPELGVISNGREMLVRERRVESVVEQERQGGAWRSVEIGLGGEEDGEVGRSENSAGGVEGGGEESGSEERVASGREEVGGGGGGGGGRGRGEGRGGSSPSEEDGDEENWEGESEEVEECV